MDERNQGTNMPASSAGRMLIIGLDGATFDILRPMMAAGRMPHLAALITEGTSGVLNSTVPPITPAAWTTFMTGKGPGRHGIIDFERYDATTGKMAFNSTYEIREPTIWQILSERNKRVGAIHVPMTYPPPKVNGFVISGFETPGIHTEFTHPPELKAEILKRWPKYSYQTNWRRRAFGGDAIFAENLRYIEDSFRQGAALTRYCGEQYGWDVLMVLFKLVDNLQHKTWKYLDPKTSGRYAKRAELAAHCFNVLDEALGDLFDYARSKQAAILIMSDHGHGSLDGKVQPNLLLREWGYLRIKSFDTAAANIQRRLNRTIDRLRGRTKKKFEANLGLENDMVVDWSQTRACVMHAGMNGFLYINLKGRQPNGIVEPGEYEMLRDELAARFRAMTCLDPSGATICVFPDVHRPEVLYNCRRDEQPWMPDLLLVPHPGLAVVRKIRGRRAVQWPRFHHLGGTHRIEGVLAAAGPNIRRGHSIKANIVDITPTVLAALGVPVPQEMEGKVLTDIFEQPPAVTYEKTERKQAATSGEVFTEAEKDALTRRLIDLGYLE